MRDNYAILARQAREKFLTYDQQEIIAKSPVRCDSRFLYLPVLDRTCMVCRQTGSLYWSEPDGTVTPSTQPGEALTVFDYLCDGRPHRSLSGEFIAMANFGGQIHTSLLESPQPSALELAADREPARFREACQALGGEPVGNADIGYRIPFFPDLPVVLRFWHSDEEFPPQLRFYWDKNALFYLRYETMYYALGILQNRLLHLINSV